MYGLIHATRVEYTSGPARGSMHVIRTSTIRDAPAMRLGGWNASGTTYPRHMTSNTLTVDGLHTDTFAALLGRICISSLPVGARNLMHSSLNQYSSIISQYSYRRARHVAGARGGIVIAPIVGSGSARGAFRQTCRITTTTG